MKLSGIEHVFFDLDRTLWDFEKSASEAFERMFQDMNLKTRGILSADRFHEIYSVHNNRLWQKYREGKIEKSKLMWYRFYLTLLDFGIDDKALSEKMGRYYLEISPRLVHLFPNAVEILEYLYPIYPLHLITNGFAEVQQTKLRVSGLNRFFKTVITSEEVGVKKPDPGIFLFAFERSGADPAKSVMIGDDYEVDILGARNAGMHQILFDPLNKERNNNVLKVDDLILIKNYL